MTTANPLGFVRPGGLIDSFRIVRALGQGAYGMVMLVERRGRHFALKLTQHREVSDHEGKTNARMSKELGCLLLLDHPNIIRPRGWGHFPDLVDDYSYLVLDYVDGWTLADWLEKARPSFAQVARVFMKLADALDYMHRRGVFHRDISLSNILIRKEDGEPFLVDFGAGDFANAPEVTEEVLPPGTNRFRAPEAVRFYAEHKLDLGARYDFRAADDQYALSVCLYDALTDAEPAKDAERRAAPRLVVNSPLMGPPPAPGEVNPRVPPGFSALVAQAVEHDTARRLPTLSALRDALEALASAGGAEWEAPVFAPPPPAVSAAPEDAATRGQAGRRKVAAAGAAAVVAAVVAFALLHETPLPQPDAPHSAPTSGPSARAPDAPPPSPAAPPVAEGPPPALVAPAQKEVPTVSAPTPPPARQPAPKRPKPTIGPTFTPEFLARCAGLSLVAAAQLGCPASQVRPTREQCPAEAVRYMENMGVWFGSGFDLLLDVNQDSEQQTFGVYRTGSYRARMHHKHRWVQEGWELEGQIWIEGELVTGRFTKLFVPSGAKDGNGDPLPREVPVCVQLGDTGWSGVKKLEGSKPGAAVLQRLSAAHFTEEWNQP